MEEENAPTINVLHAIRMIDKAWRNISKTTILNCFNKCGFSVQPEAGFEEESDPRFETDWNRIDFPTQDTVMFEDYVGCDDDVATTGILTDAEIIDTINNIDEIEEDEEDPSPPELPISAKQAKSAFCKYALSLNDVVVSRTTYLVLYLRLKIQLTKNVLIH